MTDLLVMFRNFLVAVVLAWLGFNLTPDDGQDKDNQPAESAPQSALIQ